MNGKLASIDAYIAGQPEAVRPVLQQIRAVIHAAAPDATEAISYGMPAFKGNRVLVYFAANQRHLGFYPTSSGVEHFLAELSDYQISKGAIRFPYSSPLPEALIQKIVRFRVQEDQSQ